MIELEESLRSLHFAPVPLIVLSSIRAIKTINKAARKLLGVGNASCVGQNIEHFVAPSSKSPFQSALSAAIESTLTSNSEEPITTKVELRNPQSPNEHICVDLSVSAWFPIESDTTTTTKDRDSLLGSSAKQTGSASLSLPHEAYFTISIIPSSTIGFHGSQTPKSKEAMTNVLKESIFHCMETGIVALSKDGQTEVRNQAFDNILSISSAYSKRVQTIVTSEEGGDKGVVDAVDETVTVWDGEFSKPLETREWPIFKCAYHGLSIPAVCLGLESKATGERSYVELIAKPIRDKGGYGEHIGGVVCLRDITTERKRQKLELEMQSDHHFRQTIDLMPQLIWVASGGGSVEWYSKSFLAYTGYSQQALTGAGWTIIIPEDDLEDVSMKWSHAVRTRTKFETATRIKRYDGEERWFLSRATPMKDPESGEVLRYFGTCTDIDDQVRALSTSREAQTQLESVVKHAAVNLWAVDQDGIITMAEGPGILDLPLVTPPVHSRGLEGEDYMDRERISTCKEELIGQSIYKIWGLNDVRSAVSEALQGKTNTDEIKMNGKWYRNSYTPLRAHRAASIYKYRYGSPGDVQERRMDTGEDEIVGVVIASMDVSDRKEAQKRMEETLLEKSRALSAEEAAREASRLKSEFLANMSHEIRTPIAGIIGLTELMLDATDLSMIQGENVQTIQRAAEGLLSVINDVLDFSKVEIGKLELERIPFSLPILLRDLKKLLMFTSDKKGLQLEITHDMQMEDKLLGDLGRLRQVLTNLLTNAIKFTDQGQITLSISSQEGENNKMVNVRFDIQDTGCGISAKNLARLFQPFTQADASTARRFGGSGLGLSISKNLVELMQGTIGMDSVEGSGTHAWFTIPFQRIEESRENHMILDGADEYNDTSASSIDSNHYASDTSTAVSSTMMLPTMSMDRPRKDFWILVAEDNPVNASIALQNVKKMGFNCTVASNGKIALEELSKQRYDLVLMDCQMPVCDGYEATKLIRKSHDINQRILPIIALTASAIKGDRERAYEAGMIDYLAKPVKRPALEITICKWLFDKVARQSLSRFSVSSNGVMPQTNGSLEVPIESAKKKRILANGTRSPSPMPLN